MAIEGSGDTPIAMPLSCFTVMSPNCILLLNLTILIAFIRALGEQCLNLEVWILESRNADRQAIQSSVPMSVHIDMALYVKRLIFAGNIRLASEDQIRLLSSPNPRYMFHVLASMPSYRVRLRCSVLTLRCVRTLSKS